MLNITQDKCLSCHSTDLDENGICPEFHITRKYARIVLAEEADISAEEAEQMLLEAWGWECDRCQRLHAETCPQG